MMTTNCPSCGISGLSGGGLGLLQITPVVPGSFAGLGDTQSALASLGAAAPYAAAGLGIAQGAAGGALIGGLSAWSGKAAWTGALLGGALTGVVGGATGLMGAMALRQAGDPAAVAVGDSAMIAGGTMLAVGAGLGIWAAVRILKTRKRGR